MIADIPRYYASRLKTSADHVSPDQGAKLDAIAADVAAMKADSKNQPQLVLAHRNGLVAELSAKLTGLGVEHTAVDAKWFLNEGTNREEAFKKIVENAGKPGQVLVINMQGARGVDIPLSEDAKALGGLQVRVTARSGMSRDIDIQAENRAARSGDAGSVSYYISPRDDAFALSQPLDGAAQSRGGAPRQPGEQKCAGADLIKEAGAANPTEALRHAPSSYRATA